MNERLDALETWITHPGTKLFWEHVGELWGPKAYAQRLKDAVSEARRLGKDPGAAIEIVDATNDAITEIMRWAGEEVSRLRRQDHGVEVTMARGGYR